LEDNVKQNHNVIVENRKKFTLTGVRDVLSFDDDTVMLDTALGKLAVKGRGLHVLNFNTETGDLVGEGRVHAFIYTADENGGGFFSRLFR
jgi:sporulation protein YabP